MYGAVARCHGSPPVSVFTQKNLFLIFVYDDMQCNVERLGKNTQSPLVIALGEDGVSGAFRNYLFMQLHQGRVMDFG